MGLVWRLKSILEKRLDSFWVASKHEVKQLHPHVRKQMKKGGKKKKNLSHVKLKKGNSNIFELSCV